MNPNPDNAPRSADNRRSLPDAVELARRLVASRLQRGDVALDATVGNGHDALWLARLVGAEGLVIGCDLQAAAVEATRIHLATASVTCRTRLAQMDHTQLTEMVQESEKPQVRAVMFNLGYLPGSDKTITTKPASTLSALESITTWLPSGAIITVVAYPGHAGGTAERDTVLHWAMQLDSEKWCAQQWRALNRKRPAPELVAVEHLPKPVPRNTRESSPGSCRNDQRN